MTQAVKQPVSKHADAPLAAFERLEKLSRAGNPGWLQSIRRAAMSHFTELGYPTTRNEEWRFTNIAPIARLPFHPVVEPSRNGLDLARIDQFEFEGLKCHRLVFVDGHFSPDLSTIGKLPGGVKIGSLAGMIDHEPQLVQAHLARYARSDENAFAALNTAFFPDGAFVHVPRGTVVETPVQWVFLATANQSGAVSFPRNLVVAEENSQVTILEHYVSLDDTPHVTNALTEIVLGQNAVVEHCKVQDEHASAFHVATIHAHQAQSSNYTNHSVSTGAAIARNDIRTVLDGEGCNSVLNGLFLVKGAQLVDHHTVIDHAKPHCESHEYYNGILDERARGVFNGKIFVRKDAQKTDAKQTSRALLLSDDASIDSKPQLEIFADDVKCTHGSTVGQLNEEAIFYLRARGIGEEQARHMLVAAFAGEIINRIKIDAVRAHLESHLVRRLTGKGGLDE